MALRSRDAVLALVAVAIPLMAWFTLPGPPQEAPNDLATAVPMSFSASPLPFTKSTFGPAPTGKPLITNLQIVDLDRDGLPDVLACDAVRQRVIWYHQTSRNHWDEQILGDRDLAAPCHVAVHDIDGDGDLDLAVAVLGSVHPTDEPIGKVVWLENDGQQRFKSHVVLDDLRRVADVQVGDLNADGKPDLVVAEFGYDRGRVLWLENRGGGKFRDHELLAQPGAIHVPIVDLNGDGRPDIATIVSQEEEEVVAFENLGGGQFRRRVLTTEPNFDLGSSGLFVCDLNGDGRPDFLQTLGDNLEITYPAPQAWHGCLWIENRGNWQFQSHRIGTVPGVYAAGVGDLNGDGRPDVVLACMFNDWRRPGAASLVWLENDGKGGFRPPWQIADTPTHLATVAVGDLNGDGRPEILAGSLHLLAPFEHLGRITLWTAEAGKRP